MTQHYFERLALLNVLRRAGKCYAALAAGSVSSVQVVLEKFAEERSRLALELAKTWIVEAVSSPDECAEIEDATRRASLGFASVAQLVSQLENRLSDLLEDMSEGTLDAQTHEALSRSIDELRSEIQVELRRRGSFKKYTDNRGGNSPAPRPRIFEVWFGTNRKPVVVAGVVKGFTSERSDTVRFGRCEVTIPKTHSVGSLGSPWWHRFGRGDDRLCLTTFREHSSDVFWENVRQKLSATAGTGDAVVFIHGYNVTFEEAALRAAQIGADLSIGGVMAFFSWPSRGRFLHYLADGASVEASEKEMTEFLIKFANDSGAQAIHIVAHSMGNRGLLRAINRIAINATAGSGKQFGQIILAAADVDSDTFRSSAASYTQVAHRTTLYVSSADLAIRGSRLLHGATRIGYTPPIALVDGIDTVNVTHVDLTILGHGYVSECRPVLYDMHDLLTRGSAPDERAMLRRIDSVGQIPHWQIAG